MQKHGALARIGLFAAIAAMFGAEASRNVYERRRERAGIGHVRRFKSKATGAGGSGRKGTKKASRPGRAGFKLIKKMRRTPKTELVPFALFGPANAGKRRKARRQLERQVREEHQERARLDRQRIAREYRYCAEGQR